MSTDSTTKQAWAIGGMVFAAMTLLVIGCFQIIMGVAAIAEDELFVAGPEYTYTFDTTAWGWLHAGLGAIMLLTGIFLFSRSTLARACGISFAVVSAVVNFAFLPYYPLWSMVIIALDVFVIWSLATVTQPRPSQQLPPPAPAAQTPQRPQQDWSQLNRPAQPAGTEPAAPQATQTQPPRNPTPPA